MKPVRSKIYLKKSDRFTEEIEEQLVDEEEEADSTVEDLDD